MTSLYIILWLAVGKPSFTSNVEEEIRPGCRNLQISLIVVNLSKESWVECNRNMHYQS